LVGRSVGRPSHAARRGAAQRSAAVRSEKETESEEGTSEARPDGPA